MGKRAYPTTVKDFESLRDRFVAWLEARGSQIHATTNDYELIRFTTFRGMGVIYRNKKDWVSSASNGAAQALSAFLDGSEWRAQTKPSRGNRKRHGLIMSLIERDGETCAFCGGGLTVETATIEHFVPITQGGPNKLSNMMLAHEACNQKAGHLDVRAKLELAISMRKAQ
ncbi:HNH endonuclease [Thalassospira tepidiphila]|uniref:HNH nuclease domain-containing protein n=2 Tax=Thalassospira tepidiphila TaxID=393657 RepID=A0A853KW51_9PROT|nr:HNH endonuclease [Thalassospira tepidiphila]NJB74586.1 hypothetical protein [Thalassospira tepidiphila]OAZ08081.1 hypothetical protein TH4_18705 [Thalassospira tepidiphila MCCC 1A03514]